MDQSRTKWLTELFSLLACSVLVCVSLWSYDTWKMRSQRNVSTLPQKPPAESGAQFAIDGVDFKKAPVSIVIVTSPVCKYCQASETFHSKLIAVARSSGVPSYVAVPNLRIAGAYLRKIGVSAGEAKEFRQLNLAVSGTPTIISVDKTSHIKAIWSGLANPSDELTIVQLVRSRSFSAVETSTGLAVPNLKTEELAALRLRNKINVIDVRERDETESDKDTYNIPLQELPFRAIRELNSHLLQVVDCTNLLGAQCEYAVSTLKKLRFQTATFGSGATHVRCSITPIS